MDDAVPAAWFEPLKAGKKDLILMDYYRKKALTREDMNSLIDDYYDERGWDTKTGLPTPSKLKSLGLDNLVF